MRADAGPEPWKVDCVTLQPAIESDADIKHRIERRDFILASLPRRPCYSRSVG